MEEEEERRKRQQKQAVKREVRSLQNCHWERVVQNVGIIENPAFVRQRFNLQTKGKVKESLYASWQV